MSGTIRVSNNNHFAGVPYQLLQELPFIDYREGTPYENACRLHEREVDLSLIPIYDYFSHGGYCALDFGMGCRQKSGSMILYAERPIEELKRIYIYSSSRTSLALLRILLHAVWKNDPQIIRQQRHSIFDMVKGDSGVLGMHDTPGSLENFPIAIDLISAWYRFAKVPMPLLIWAFRPGTLTLEQAHEITRVFYLGDKVKSEMARTLAGQYGLREDDAHVFIGENRRYYFDSFLQNGVEQFKELAVQYRLLPSTGWTPARRTLSGDSFAAEIPTRTVSEILKDSRSGAPLSMTDALRLATECPLRNLKEAALWATGRITAVGAQAGEFPTLFSFAGVESQAGLEQAFSSLRLACAQQSTAVSIAEILKIARDFETSPYVIASQCMTSGISATLDSRVPILIEQKCVTESSSFIPTEWLDLAALFHSTGFSSIVSVRASSADNWEERIIHLEKLRTLGQEGGKIRGMLVWEDTGHPCGSDEIERLTSIAFLLGIPVLQDIQVPALIACAS